MKENIFIGIPNMGEIRVETWILTLNWVTRGIPYGLKIFPTPPGTRPEPVARNLIVEEFLRQKDFKYLLMLDADVVPPPNILDLCRLNLDIVGAFIMICKNGELLPMVLKKTEEGEFEIVKEIRGNSLVEVDATGTGCLMIHRRVLETMTKPYFHFVFGPEGNLLRGEDFEFCDKARQHGFKIWVHTGYVAEHYNKVGLAGIHFARLRVENDNRK